MAQSDLLSVEIAMKIIENRTDDQFKELLALNKELDKLDSRNRTLILDQIEKTGPKDDPYFSTRLKYLLVQSVLKDNYPEGLELLTSLLDELIQQAYNTGDELLIAQCYREFGRVMFAYNQFDLAVSYTQNAIELREKQSNPIDIYLDYILLGEILFHTRDFPSSIQYTLRGLNLSENSLVGGTTDIRYLNTLGQSYLQLNKLDSAEFYLEKAFYQAQNLQNQIWMGINSSYLGQVSFLKGDYQQAKSRLLFDYHVNKSNEFNIAGNSMRWLGRIYLVNDDLDSAKLCVNESIALLQKLDGKIALQTSRYLEEAYFLKSEIFKKESQLDSALHYYKLYSELHNANERMVLLSSNQVTNTKVSNEKNRYALLTVQREIEKEEKVRNLLIASIFVLTLVSGLILFFKQRQLKYKNEIFRLQKAADDAELEQAKSQIGIFTTNLLEKAALIESLEHKFIEREFSEERQHYLSELSNQKILTDEDWKNFKGLFDKLHPGFFMMLKEKFPDITLAEQRLAAMIRLQLTTREMASILAISEASALRTRSRLKARLNLNPDIDLEDYLMPL